MLLVDGDIFDRDWDRSRVIYVILRATGYGAIIAVKGGKRTILRHALYDGRSPFPSFQWMTSANPERS